MISCMDMMEVLKNEYSPASSAWILIHAAKGHIKSLHYLDCESKFDPETLGVKNE
jgi:hypothetical protein